MVNRSIRGGVLRPLIGQDSRGSFLGQGGLFTPFLWIAILYPPLVACSSILSAVPVKTKPVLSPSMAIESMQPITIKASIIAYSTVVGPSVSLRKRASLFFSERFIILFSVGGFYQGRLRNNGLSEKVGFLT